MRTPPFLPFLDGPADFKVGLKPIPLSQWLTPDWEAAHLPEKHALLRNHLGDVYRAAPDAGALEAETAALIGAALGVDAGRTLPQAAALVSDDLVVMAPTEEGFVNRACVLCSPTFFSAEEAMGLSLNGLHGPVPDRLGPEQTQALGARIGRVFGALQADTVLERFNWTVQAGPERYTPSGAALRARAAAANAEEAAALLHLRVERQTIRKLPQTGAVLFTIRISIDPLAHALSAPGVAAGFARAWSATPTHVRGYKKWAVLEHLVARLLSDLGQHQP
jgi:hypothetical protein